MENAKIKKKIKCDILSNFQTVWWQCGLPKSAIICKMLLWHWRENDEFLRGHICPLLFQTQQQRFDVYEFCVPFFQWVFRLCWWPSVKVSHGVSTGRKHNLSIFKGESLAVDQKSINSKRWKRVNEDQIKLFLSPVLTAFHNNIFATFHYIMGVP